MAWKLVMAVAAAAVLSMGADQAPPAPTNLSDNHLSAADQALSRRGRPCPTP